MYQSPSLRPTSPRESSEARGRSSDYPDHRSHCQLELGMSRVHLQEELARLKASVTAETQYGARRQWRGGLPRCVALALRI